VDKPIWNEQSQTIESASCQLRPSELGMCKLPLRVDHVLYAPESASGQSLTSCVARLGLNAGGAGDGLGVGVDVSDMGL
jgi:hypothetical protein